MPTPRRPQINFQVEAALKLLYDDAKDNEGLWVTRLCAAGLLLMVEDPVARERAMDRLRLWEAEYGDASPVQIRDFVRGAQRALRGTAPDSRPSRKAPPVRRTAKRG